MPSIIKVDQIQSDTGSIVYPSNVSLGNTSVTNFGSTGVNARLHVEGVINLPDGQALAFGDGTSRPAITGNKATGFLAVNVAGTERARFNNSGTVILQGGSTSATGTGITFPASQNASTDPNTLDDYEEGNWTPVMTRASVSPSLTTTTTGRYLKIGKKVTLWGTITISAVSSQGTNVWIITGLPFSLTSGQRGTMGAAGNFSATSISASTNVTAVGDAVVDSYLYCRNADGSTTNANFQAGTLYFTITYETPS